MGKAADRETNRELKALGGEPEYIDEEDLDGLRRRRLRRKFDERGVGSVAHPPPPRIYVPVAMPLNAKYARNRAFYPALGTRVMSQIPIATPQKAKKKKHMKGKKHKKKRKHPKKHRKNRDGKHDSVSDVVKQVEGVGKDLAEKKKQSLKEEAKETSKKTKHGPKAEKSGKIFKHDDVVDNSGEHQKPDSNKSKERAFN